MTIELDNLIDRWEESCLDGKELTATELTVECPEMLEELEQEIAETKAADAFSSKLFQACPTIKAELLRPKPSEYKLPDIINNRYELREVLGIGHFGIVWLAKDIKLSRDVAIKFPARHLLYSQEKINEFEREARLLAELSQATPYIVMVHDFGNVKIAADSEHNLREIDLPYFVMELMDCTLDKCEVDWDEDPLGTAEVIAHLADALHAAHICKSGPLVHCDIKPNNIFIKNDARGGRQVKLGDFGLVLGSDTVDFKNYKLYGSIDYISPERLQGQTGDVRSDQYSLAVVFYVLLTGVEPFSQTSGVTELLENIKVGNKPPPATLNTALNDYPQLQEVCLKAMSANPNERYYNSKQFADALRDACKAIRNKQSHSTSKFITIAGILIIFSLLIILMLNSSSRPVQAPKPIPVKPIQPVKKIIPKPPKEIVNSKQIQSKLEEIKKSKRLELELKQLKQKAENSKQLKLELEQLKTQVKTLNNNLISKKAKVPPPPKKYPVNVMANMQAAIAQLKNQMDRNKRQKEIQDSSPKVLPSKETWTNSTSQNKPKLPEYGVKRKATRKDAFDFIGTALMGGRVPKQSLRMLTGYLEAHSSYSHKAGLLGIIRVLERYTPPVNDVALVLPHVIKLHKSSNQTVRTYAQKALKAIESKYELTKKQKEKVALILKN